MVVSKLAHRFAAGAAVLLVVVSGVACDAILGSLHDRPLDSGVPDAAPRSDATPHSDTGPHSEGGSQRDGGHHDAGLHIDGGFLVDAEIPQKDAPPSCQGSGAGLFNCPAGMGQESCCTSLEVEGGAYYRSYNAGDAGFGVCEGGKACDGGTETGNMATVSGFRLDKYLVTVGRFRRFRDLLNRDAGLPASGSGRHTYLNDGGGLTNSGSGAGHELGWDALTWNSELMTDAGKLECSGGSETWTPDAGANEDLPITCVTWYEAYAFCIWDGGFLPSEAEWEYAAAGGAYQREYPWGTAGPDGYAVYGNPGGILPVGSAEAGAARWGQLDMAGEAYEWVLDYYAPYVDPCMNCAYLEQTSSRSIRTHRFGGGTAYLTPPYRNSTGGPTGRNSSAGFRCARAP
jgi:formylglycine-generating enzyme required for sulfatase activity